MKKKAEGLPLETIVLLIIVLVVIIVILLFITGIFGKGSNFFSGMINALTGRG